MVKIFSLIFIFSFCYSAATKASCLGCLPAEDNPVRSNPVDKFYADPARHRVIIEYMRIDEMPGTVMQYRDMLDRRGKF